MTRSLDLHSRRLAASVGLTGPQLACLRALVRLHEVPPSVLARELDLSHATVTGIVDRLTARDLVTRRRSETDRRLVTVAITGAGIRLADAAPSLLPERLVEGLGDLDDAGCHAVADALERIVSMLGIDPPEPASASGLAVHENRGANTTRETGNPDSYTLATRGAEPNGAEADPSPDLSVVHDFNEDASAAPGGSRPDADVPPDAHRFPPESPGGS